MRWSCHDTVERRLEIPKVNMVDTYCIITKSLAYVAELAL